MLLGGALGRLSRLCSSHSVFTTQLLQRGYTTGVEPSSSPSAAAAAPPKKKKWDRRMRGYTGRTWPGRQAGAPRAENGEEIEGFHSIVLDLKRIRKKGGSAKVQAVVCVGNKNGLAGWAKSRQASPLDAIAKARNEAALNLYAIPYCEEAHGCRVLYHDMNAKWFKTQMFFKRTPPGTGIVAQRMTKSIMQLSGITDAHVKLKGRMGAKIPHIKAVFNALLSQETHEELAEQTGKIVVERRSNMGNVPVVVARPSEAAVKRRLELEKSNPRLKFWDEMQASQAHRMKSIKEVHATVRYSGEIGRAHV